MKRGYYVVARKAGFFTIRKKFMDEKHKVQENPSKLMAKTRGFSRVKTRNAANASKKACRKDPFYMCNLTFGCRRAPTDARLLMSWLPFPPPIRRLFSAKVSTNFVAVEGTPPAADPSPTPPPPPPPLLAKGGAPPPTKTPLFFLDIV